MDIKTLNLAKPAALLTALFALVLVALAPSKAAAAEVTGGDAVWGVKESFRNYILNVPPPFPPASITTSNGASQAAGNGPFTFVNGTGQIDPEAGTADLDFAGTVTFSKPAHGINIVLENPKIQYSGNTGTLLADVTDTNGVAHPDEPLANLDLTGIAPIVTETSAALNDIPATSTANVQPIFGQYPEGTELDPVSFEVAANLAPDPYPTAAGKIQKGKKTQKIGKTKTVKVAKVTCDATSCSLKAPKKLKGKIKKGKKKGSLSLKVKAPKTLSEGQTVTVKAKAKKKQVRKLGKKGKVKLEAALKLSGDEALTVSKTAKITVKK